MAQVSRDVVYIGLYQRITSQNGKLSSKHEVPHIPSVKEN